MVSLQTTSLLDYRLQGIEVYTVATPSAWIGPVTCKDRTESDWTGQDRTGQDRTGQDRTGQDQIGTPELARLVVGVVGVVIALHYTGGSAPCVSAVPSRGKHLSPAPTAPSTREEHQDNTSMAVHQVAEVAGIFDTYWWGYEQAQQLHETMSMDCSAFDHMMQQQAQIYANSLGPVAQAYLIGPGAAGFYTELAEDAVAGLTSAVIGRSGAKTQIARDLATASVTQAGTPVAEADSVSDGATVANIFNGLPGSSLIPTNAVNTTSNLEM
ncbi:hypothetical protein B0H17DRAFT_1135957 [Mycena rosella]|uniref:Uncharacterized protein n=1 Tax=Mycena rosella TaxID=1033263 RepID=A0AAD7DBR7_MYCRO|nr:hypothetical protein B0H17DRAFT_1135957 [Mycena rosella]